MAGKQPDTESHYSHDGHRLGLPGQWVVRRDPTGTAAVWEGSPLHTAFAVDGECTDYLAALRDFNHFYVPELPVKEPNLSGLPEAVTCWPMRIGPAELRPEPPIRALYEAERKHWGFVASLVHSCIWAMIEAHRDQLHRASIVSLVEAPRVYFARSEAGAYVLHGEFNLTPNPLLAAAAPDWCPWSNQTPLADLNLGLRDLSGRLDDLAGQARAAIRHNVRAGVSPVDPVHGWDLERRRRTLEHVRTLVELLGPEVDALRVLSDEPPWEAAAAIRADATAHAGGPDGAAP